MRSKIDYAQSYALCEQEDLRRTGRVQAGFHTLVLRDGQAVAVTDHFPHDVAAAAKALQAAAAGEAIGPKHSLVSAGDLGRWLRHEQGGWVIFEQPEMNGEINGRQIGNGGGVGNGGATEGAAPLDRERLLEASRGNLWKLCSGVCREVQTALDVDRVMVYRFHDDWSGEIIAEAVRKHLEPFLGLHYPPTDIPAQARDLYLQTGSRHIFSSRKADWLLLASAGEAGEIDLSYALGRSVSPYHLEYLRNMGSESTASCALVAEGRLWGLLSLHYQRDRSPSLEEFVYLQRAKATIDGALNVILAKERELQEERLQRLQRQFAEDLDAHSDPFWALMLSRTAVHRLIGAQGVSLIIDNELCNIGKTPLPAALQQICRIYGEGLEPMESRFVEELDEEIAEAGRRGVAGCAITRLSSEPAAFLIAHRIEVNQTVNWGGDPRRQPSEEERVRVSPRKSFETWVEMVQGRCAPWTEMTQESLGLALETLQGFFDVSPRELALLIRNGFRQALRRNDAVRSSALELIDGIQSAIAVGVEQSGRSEGQIIAMNSSAFDAFAVAPAEAAGMDLSELERITGIDLQDVGESSFLATLTTANNGIRECEVTIGLLFEARTLDGSADASRVLMFEFRDVTDTKRIEAALTAARDRVMRDAQLRAEYFAKLNHELRTPLNALVGMSDFLLTTDRESLPEDTRTALEMIRTSSLHMSDIVKNSLENAAAAQTVDERDFREIDVASLAGEALAFVRRSVEGQGLQAAVAVPEGLTVFADPRGLRQVLLNLLSNAIKYNVPGGAISIEGDRLAPGLVEVRVRDTGLGMTEAQVEACMVPFRRFTEQEGAGLGLSICSQLVSLMGGVLNIRSRPGEGTTVEVVLQAAGPSMQTPEPGASEARAAQEP